MSQSYFRLFFLSLLIGGMSFTTMSCQKNQGCTDPNSESYDQDAESDDGSCRYRYLTQVTLNYFHDLDGNGNQWDPGGAPDLVLRIAPASDTVWTYVTTEYSNTLSPATMIIYGDVQLTNTSWQFELWDNDWPSADDFIAAGQFNPLSDGSNGIINVTNTDVNFDFHYDVRD